jgi:hypothetical protein
MLQILLLPLPLVQLLNGFTVKNVAIPEAITAFIFVAFFYR